MKNAHTWRGWSSTFSAHLESEAFEEDTSAESQPTPYVKAHIAPILSDHSLRVLDLSHSPITDRDASSFAAAIMDCTGLEVLNLSHTQIGPRFFVQLLDTIAGYALTDVTTVLGPQGAGQGLKYMDLLYSPSRDIPGNYTRILAENPVVSRPFSARPASARSTSTVSSNGSRPGTPAANSVPQSTYVTARLGLKPNETAESALSLSAATYGEARMILPSLFSAYCHPSRMLLSTEPSSLLSTTSKDALGFECVRVPGGSDALELFALMRNGKRRELGGMHPRLLSLSVDHTDVLGERSRQSRREELVDPEYDFSLDDVWARLAVWCVAAILGAACPGAGGIGLRKSLEKYAVPTAKATKPKEATIEDIAALCMQSDSAEAFLMKIRPFLNKAPDQVVVSDMKHGSDELGNDAVSSARTGYVSDDEIENEYDYEGESPYPANLAGTGSTQKARIHDEEDDDPTFEATGEYIRAQERKVVQLAKERGLFAIGHPSGMHALPLRVMSLVGVELPASAPDIWSRAIARARRFRDASESIHDGAESALCRRPQVTSCLDAGLIAIKLRDPSAGDKASAYVTGHTNEDRITAQELIKLSTALETALALNGRDAIADLLELVRRGETTHVLPVTRGDFRRRCYEMTQPGGELSMDGKLLVPIGASPSDNLKALVKEAKDEDIILLSVPDCLWWLYLAGETHEDSAEESERGGPSNGVEEEDTEDDTLGKYNSQGIWCEPDADTLAKKARRRQQMQHRAELSRRLKRMRWLVVYANPELERLIPDETKTALGLHLTPLLQGSPLGYQSRLRTELEELVLDALKVNAAQTSNQEESDHESGPSLRNPGRKSAESSIPLHDSATVELPTGSRIERFSRYADSVRTTGLSAQYYSGGDGDASQAHRDTNLAQTTETKTAPSEGKFGRMLWSMSATPLSQTEENEEYDVPASYRPPDDHYGVIVEEPRTSSPTAELLSQEYLGTEIKEPPSALMTEALPSSALSGTGNDSAPAVVSEVVTGLELPKSVEPREAQQSFVATSHSGHHELLPNLTVASTTEKRKDLHHNHDRGPTTISPKAQPISTAAFSGDAARPAPLSRMTLPAHLKATGKGPVLVAQPRPPPTLPKPVLRSASGVKEKR